MSKCLFSFSLTKKRKKIDSKKYYIMLHCWRGLWGSPLPSCVVSCGVPLSWGGYQMAGGVVVVWLSKNGIRPVGGASKLIFFEPVLSPTCIWWCVVIIRGRPPTLASYTPKAGSLSPTHLHKASGSHSPHIVLITRWTRAPTPYTSYLN